jgi:uncharacterized protein (DUF885 family)
MNRKYVLTLFWVAGLLCSSVPAVKAQNNLYLQSSDVHDLMTQYRADMGSLRRFYFVDNSPEARDRFRSVTADYLKKMEALNFNKMNEGSRVDYILFNRDLKEGLRELEVEEKEMNQLKPWFGFSDQIYAIEKTRRRGTALNGPRAALDLNEVNKQIILSKKNVADQDLDQNLITRAIQTTSGLRKALKNVHDFYNEYDPEYTWWMALPYQKTDSLLKNLEGFYQKKGDDVKSNAKDDSGIKGKPVGREELIRQLQYEMIPYTPEELIDLANKEFAWCDREMLKASHEMGFGDDWKKAMEKVKNTYVPVGKQPEMIMGLYDEAIAFLKKNDLITIPPIADETWRMIMMTPKRQLVNPFFTGGEVLSISYPTLTMEHEDKMMSMRGNNPHFSKATVHHELIAGHHLQGFMNNRYKTYRNFRTPFWTEGWALYWEFILWDLDFPKSPKDKIGMLFWRSHRCARIIFSLNYHLGKWTPQQCIDFLVDRVGHERANAEGEVRRSFAGGYGQLYQLAYMMGGLQFYALKKELVDSGKMTYKQYHDAVMQENSMPVEMLRAIITKQSLPKDYKTSWKFYK